MKGSRKQKKNYEKSLSELLGITGAQIKFLKNIKIPEDLEKFSEEKKQ